MKKLLVLMMIFGLSYSQDIVNISLSTQELKNGIILFNQRKYAAAIQAFQTSLAHEPLNHAAKYRLGLAYLYAGYAQTAANTWEELVRSGTANYQVKEQLNNLYFIMSVDENYSYDTPYIFREFYNGYTQGGHDIVRTSFMAYDGVRDLKYISSTAAKQVVVMDSANNIVAKYGSRLFMRNRLEMPMGLAIYGDSLFVSDFKKDRIYQFKRDNFGTLINEFGETGAGASQMSGPMGLAVSDDDYLYIVDNGNARVQKFLPDGTHVYNFGSDYLYRPSGVAVISNIIYVTDIDKNRKGRLVLFDESGNFITNAGGEFLREPRGLSERSQTTEPITG